VPNWFGYLSDFVNVSENLVIANDVATPLHSSVAPIEKEELEEASFDVNVFQRLHEEDIGNNL